jgi:WD40 repeat protein
LAFCGSGNTLACAGFGRDIDQIGIFPLSDGPSVGLKGHSASIAALDADGDIIVSGDLAGFLCIWSLCKLECLATLRAVPALRGGKVVSNDLETLGKEDDHCRHSIQHLAVQGDIVISCKHVRFGLKGPFKTIFEAWSISRRACISFIECKDERFHDVVSVALKGESAVTADYETVQVWAVNDGVVRNTWQHPSPVYAMCLANDTVFGICDNVVCLWSLATGQALQRIQRSLFTPSFIHNPTGRDNPICLQKRGGRVANVTGSMLVNCSSDGLVNVTSLKGDWKRVTSLDAKCAPLSVATSGRSNFIASLHYRGSMSNCALQVWRPRQKPETSLPYLPSIEAGGV